MANAAHSHTHSQVTRNSYRSGLAVNRTRGRWTAPPPVRFWVCLTGRASTRGLQASTPPRALSSCSPRSTTASSSPSSATAALSWPSSSSPPTTTPWCSSPKSSTLSCSTPLVTPSRLCRPSRYGRQYYFELRSVLLCSLLIPFRILSTYHSIVPLWSSVPLVSLLTCGR